MYSTGLLVLPARAASAAAPLMSLLRQAAARVSTRLYVHLLPEPHKPPPAPPHYCPLVADVYSASVRVCPALDVRVLLTPLKSAFQHPSSGSSSSSSSLTGNSMYRTALPIELLLWPRQDNQPEHQRQQQSSAAVPVSLPSSLLPQSASASDEFLSRFVLHRADHIATVCLTPVHDLCDAPSSGSDGTPWLTPSPQPSQQLSSLTASDITTAAAGGVGNGAAAAAGGGGGSAGAAAAAVGSAGGGSVGAAAGSAGGGGAAEVAAPPPEQMFERVAVGGTWHGLHAGHRLLLSVALLSSRRHLVVGVSSDALVADKLLAELVPGCSERCSAVQKLAQDLDCTVDTQTVVLQDAMGPTRYDASLQLLVVSAETAAGAGAINSARAAAALPPMHVRVAPLILADQRQRQEQQQQQEEENEEGGEMEDVTWYCHENKVSSTSLRVQQLGELRKPRLLPSDWHQPAHLSPSPSTPLSSVSASTVTAAGGSASHQQQQQHQRRHRRPYVIGLTGGLASGKSTICQHLAARGARVISCDQLAHQVYSEPGSAGYRAVVQRFGRQVLTPGGTCIDRRQLAALVFANDDEDNSGGSSSGGSGGGNRLSQLTDIVWPLVADELQRRLLAETAPVVVVEAALLLEAGWQRLCDEVWVVLVPPAEAVRRSVQRDGVSAEHARQRVQRQLSNSARVAHAHVVFCSLWRRRFTRHQVDGAWNRLCTDLGVQLPSADNC